MEAKEFTIGEMSKMHHIPIKTLRYYDAIGLLKPAHVDQNTGYRYYSVRQFDTLVLIKSLKVLGLTLDEIKKHVQNMNCDYFLQLLVQQQDETAKKIAELQEISRVFLQRQQEIETALGYVMGEMRISRFPDRRVVRCECKMKNRVDVQRADSMLERMIRRKTLTPNALVIMAEQDVREKKFNDYSAICRLESEVELDRKLPISVIPGGEYACVYYRGTHAMSQAYWETALEYIEQHGYAVCGDAVRRVIVGRSIADSDDDYLAEIQIPVRKLSD